MPFGFMSCKWLNACVTKIQIKKYMYKHSYQKSDKSELKMHPLQQEGIKHTQRLLSNASMLSMQN